MREGIYVIETFLGGLNIPSPGYKLHTTKRRTRLQTTTTYRVRLLGHLDGAGRLGGSASVHDPVVLDQVADDALRVVQRALGFVDDLNMMNKNLNKADNR